MISFSLVIKRGASVEQYSIVSGSKMNSYGNSFLCFGYNFSFFFVLIVDEDCSKMIIFFILDCNSFKVEGRKRVL